MHTLRVGDLAYFDCFAGLLPCKVLAITGPSGLASSSQTVQFRLTASRGAYRRGECLDTSGLHVCPRSAIRGNRIRAYVVESN